MTYADTRKALEAAVRQHNEEPVHTRDLFDCVRALQPDWRESAIQTLIDDTIISSKRYDLRGPVEGGWLVRRLPPPPPPVTHPQAATGNPVLDAKRNDAEQRTDWSRGGHLAGDVSQQWNRHELDRLIDQRLRHHNLIT